MIKWWILINNNWIVIEGCELEHSTVYFYTNGGYDCGEMDHITNSYFLDI